MACAVLQVYLDWSRMDGADELFTDLARAAKSDDPFYASQIRDVHNPKNYPIPCDV